jgi:MFS family permease
MISESLLFFIVMRFIQAVGASVVYIVSQSIINETFDEKGKNSVMGILELYQPIAWILSPFAGSIIMEVSNWRLSFLVLALAQMIGIVFFKAYPANSHKKKRIRFSFSIIIQDYKSILKNSVFVIYALIPGLFAGGYMIFATSCPFICSQFYAGSSGNIAIFSTIPLFFYIIATFAYRIVVDRFGVKIARRVGTSVYAFFGIYLSYLVIFDIHWSPRILLILMCIQCFGSAFLVPVSVLKALQNSAILSTNIGASTVVIFRNLIMSFCISAGVKFNSSITTIMACIFITVATIILLITTRKFLRSRANRKICK